MSIVKWRPLLEPFEEMDKMFSNLMPTNAHAQDFMPAIDVYEKNNQIIVEIQLSGMEVEDTNIFVENNILYIKGENEKKSEVEDKNYYRKEIKRGSFCRSIALPADIIESKINAEAENGVLKISIPKKSDSQAKPKKIKITQKKKNTKKKKK